jgi:hypothetical protein
LSLYAVEQSGQRLRTVQGVVDALVGRDFYSSQEGRLDGGGLGCSVGCLGRMAG